MARTQEQEQQEAPPPPEPPEPEPGRAHTTDLGGGDCAGAGVTVSVMDWSFSSSRLQGCQDMQNINQTGGVPPLKTQCPRIGKFGWKPTPYCN